MRTTFLALAILAGLGLAGCRIKKDPSYDAAAATCAPVAAACSDHSQCCSFACVQGSCIANQAQGGICRTSDDCNFTMTCVSGRCAPGYACQPTLGDSCTSNNDCCSGNCLGENSTVYPPSPGTCGAESPPVIADLGGPFTVPYYATTVLHATASDPDPEDVLYYAWDVLSAPTNATAIGWTASGTGTAGANPSLFLSAKGSYTIRVRVADGPPSQRNRATTSATVTVVAVNLPPVVDADPTHLASTALRNTAISLVGAVSDPNGAATPVSCAWYAKPPGLAEISTPVVSFSSCPANPSTNYTTPIDGPEGVWEFRLEASDGELTTSAVRQIDVVNAPPIAQACAYECASPPASAEGGIRVGNLGPDGQPAPSIPLRGTATDANGDVGQTKFTWQWQLDSAPAGSTRAAGTILGSSALAGTHAPPFVGALDPDVAGTYVVSLHVDDGWPNGTAESTVLVYAEPYLRPLHPLDGSGLPSGSIADAVYLHGATAASDRIVFVGRNSILGNGLWIIDPESSPTSVSAATAVNESPTCVGLTRDGATAIIGGTDAFNTAKWERVTLSGPTANGTNPFGTGWTGTPNDIVSTGGHEFVVSGSGLVHTFSNSGVGSTTTTAVPTCDNCNASLNVVGSHGAAAQDVLWLLTASGELRRFDVQPNGRVSMNPLSLVATSAQSDLWVSAVHDTTGQEVAVSAGTLLNPTTLATVGALPAAAKYLDTATPSGSTGSLVGVMIGGDGSLVSLDGSYASAGTLRVPRAGWQGTGYPLTAEFAFVRSDGSARYAVLRAVVGPEVRWYLARY